MAQSPTENYSTYINIRLKPPTQPKKEPIPPQSTAQVQNKLEYYEKVRQKKLQKLREEYEKKELESMTPCTKPFQRKPKSPNDSSITNKKIERTINSNYNDNIFNESIPEYAFEISYNSSPNSYKAKKKYSAMDESDLLKDRKCSDRKKNAPHEYWDDDGSLLNTQRHSSNQTDSLQNDDEYYLDIPPSPKRVEPKNKYPSLIERSINSEKSRSPDSSFTNSPKSTSPISQKSNSPYSSSKSNSTSPKANSPKSTAASFKEFEERQQKLLDSRESKRKEAEKKLIDEANRSYTLSKSEKIYKSLMQRNGEPIRQRKKEEEEESYTYIPDTSISRKHYKDYPPISISKSSKEDSNNLQNEKDKSNNQNNRKSEIERTLRIEDVEAQCIAREVQLLSREIEEETEKMADCTFTPQKFSKYNLNAKSSSPDHLNKYIENADKQMKRARTNGQKIRNEEINDEKENSQIPHKMSKPQSSTQKLMSIVNELKKEADDERYNEKKNSLYERSLGTMRRRCHGKHYSSLNCPESSCS